MSLNLRIILGSFLTLTLGACGSTADSKTDKFAACPKVALVADTAGIVSGSAQNWTARAAVDDYKATCKITKPGATTDIAVTVTAQRANAGGGEKLTYPLYVAVIRTDDSVINKQAYQVTLDFAAGESVTHKNLTLRQEASFKNNTAADKTILFGFQLTPAQLAAIRALRAKP